MKNKDRLIYPVFLVFLIVLLLDHFEISIFANGSLVLSILLILIVLVGIHSWYSNRGNSSGLKCYIKTTMRNYILNLSISGAIALFVGIILPFTFAYRNGAGYPWFFIIPAFFIFHHFYRAGEYMLTKKILTISPNLFEGYEEKPKRAKGLFIYYLTSATLLSLFFLYLYLRNW